MFSVTISIIVITVLISLAGFNSPKVINDLIFSPYTINHEKNQWYRFITHGFIHGGWFHLIINMWAFYSFGESLEKYYFAQPELFGTNAKIFYIFLYVGGLIASSIPDYFKYRDIPQYRALGASGAISSIVFATIILSPGIGIGLLFIPIPIPGYIFGVGFILISAYFERKGNTNWAHGAHIYGGLFGILFVIIATKIFTNYNAVESFIMQISRRY
ncbi:MAG: rhomboid family intramembrane serine protease [Chitinophagaceae bacterium]